MNSYGRLAKAHWARTDPVRYAAIGDPEAFFTALGEQADTQIRELATTLAGQDPPGEEYLAKVGRLNMARLQAEEAVLAELVWIPEPERSEDPTSDWVTRTMRDIAGADPDSPPLD